MRKHGYWLASLLSVLFLTLPALNARAQDLAPYNQGPGASFVNEAPMDLAAAVSNTSAGIPNSGNYLVQFTNGGRFVYNKYTNPPKQVGATTTQWEFWCNSTGLSGCDPSGVNQPYDTQISYDPINGRWIVAALSLDESSNKGAYLYIGISKNADPSGAYYQYALSACNAYYTGAYGDNPIMGISTGANGRILVDLPCYFSPNDYGAEEFFDIDLHSAESGSALDASCADSSCRTLINNPNITHLRPTNNLGAYSEILLSSIFLDNQSHAGLYVYKLTSSSTVSGDSLAQFDPRPGDATPLPFVSPTVIYSAPGATGFLVSQPGCSASSICAIQTDTLDPEGGAVQTAADGTDRFETSFAAVALNGVDSYYLAFILNDSNGVNKFVTQGVTGGIVGYASSAMDSDHELVVNYTTLQSTGSNTAVDVINWNPIASASVVQSYPPIASTTVETPSFDCNLSVCRWGDYTAEVWDPTCEALNQGKAAECGLFWTTAEYIPTPTGGGRGTIESSLLFAAKDNVLSGDTGAISFVGSSNAETECSASPCSVTFTAPAGTQVGDVLLVAMSASQNFSWVPSLPPGWTALTFQNQGGNPNFASTDSANYEETAWLLAHVYTASDTGSYTFSADVTPQVSEVGGLILGYRGVHSQSLNFSAWGFGSTVDSATVSLAQITAPAYNQLVAVFKDASDDYGGENSTLYFSAGSWNPPLTAETTMTITGGWPGFAADAWTYGGGTYGRYSVNASLSGLPLGWAVLLPSGLE